MAGADQSKRASDMRAGAYALVVLATLNFFNYANRTVVLSMYDDLRAVFGLSDGVLGLLTTLFMASNAVVALPAGWAADRFDRRRVIAIGAIVWSIGSLVVASTAALGLGEATLLTGRLLAGFGSGALVPVANALLCDVFPEQHKARTVSVFNLGLAFGAVAGFAAGLAGYPRGILVVAIPPLLLAALAWNLRVGPRRQNVAEMTVDEASWLRFSRDAIAILKVRTLRYTVLGAVSISFAVGGYSAWFVDFVVHEKGFEVADAATFFAIAALSAGLCGVLSGGALADRLLRRFAYGRLAAMVSGLVLALPFAVTVLAAGEGVLFLTASWFLLFFLNFYHGPMGAVVDDLVPDERAATAQAGLVSLMHLVGTAPSAYAVGLLAERVGLLVAMVVPTVAVVAAAIAFALGCPSMAADRARIAGVRAGPPAGGKL